MPKSTKSQPIRSWDDAIADTRAELDKCSDEARAKELRYSLLAFELAKQRGDKWPAEVRA